MDILSTLFHQRSRAIGVVIPDVIISERHTDTLNITAYPVESGATISDHAHVAPASLVMEVGFGGGGSLVDFFDTSAVGLSLAHSPSEIYQTLRDMQSQREPCDVVTGKRLYHNMLIKEIAVTTDNATENVLRATLTLQEVIVTKTTSVADKQNMTQGADTSAVQNTGTKTPKPVNTPTGADVAAGGRGA